MVGEPLHLFGFCVVREEVHGPLTVGQEVDGVTYPHRKGVAGILMGDLLDGVISKFEQPDGSGSTSAVLLPGDEGPRQRGIGYLASIRRIRGLVGHRHGEGFRKTATYTNRIKLIEAAIAKAPRIEHYPLPIGSPPHHCIARRMVGEPFRHSSFGWNYKDIIIAVILTGEGDVATIRGVFWPQLLPGVGGETTGFSASGGHGP